MGTSCTINIKKGKKESETLVTFYKHNDSDIGNFGVDLFEFLATIPPLKHPDHEWGPNSMYCIATQIVAHYKDTPGDFYIAETDTIDSNLVYNVYRDNNNEYLMGEVAGEWCGKVSEFDKYFE
jgi:hypothetical protein